MSTKLTDLLDVPIAWEASYTEICTYRASYEGFDLCLLVNADFPEGPFYRLFGGDEFIEFDDAPAHWVLPPPPSQGPDQSSQGPDQSSQVLGQGSS